MDNGDNQNQAGWVFTPDGGKVAPDNNGQPAQQPLANQQPQQQAPAKPEAPADAQAAPDPAPDPSPEQPSDPNPYVAPASSGTPNPYQTQQPQPQAQAASTQGDSVQWHASEFIGTQKTPGWYFILAIGTLLVAAVVYFVTRDIFSVVVISMLGIIFGIVGARQPKALDYAISSRGIQIGVKQYPFSTFKSFSILREDSLNSISLMPIKRFMPTMAMYYDPKDEDNIAETLSNYLPFEERGHDMVDRLAQRLRF